MPRTIREYIWCGPKLDKTNTSYLLILPQENSKVFQYYIGLRSLQGDLLVQYYIGLRSLQGDLSVKIKHIFTRNNTVNYLK